MNLLCLLVEDMRPLSPTGGAKNRSIIKNRNMIVTQVQHKIYENHKIGELDENELNYLIERIYHGSKHFS